MPKAALKLLSDGPRKRVVKARPMGVIRQVRIALKAENRLSAVVGAVLGGFVPLAAFAVAHSDISTASPGMHDVLMAGMVCGGLLFSAKTVFDWALSALGHKAKAFGFVVLAEGAMTFSHLWGVNLAALAVLVGINAVATACNLAVDKRLE